MKIEKLRKLAGREEIDYPFLVSALSEYARPREKISSWLKSGELIRIKKGLYIFGRDVAHQSYSKELIANLIYGPSAVSLSYALSYYGLIPERPTTITSITSKRNKSFRTPVGDFTYRYLNHQKYPIGIEIMKLNSKRSFFIASPEKALCDFIHLEDKEIELSTVEDVERYLFHDLRIDENVLFKFRKNRLNELAIAYVDSRLDLLRQFIQQRKKD